MSKHKKQGVSKMPNEEITPEVTATDAEIQDADVVGSAPAELTVAVVEEVDVVKPVIKVATLPPVMPTAPTQPAPSVMSPEQVLRNRKSNTFKYQVNENLKLCKASICTDAILTAKMHQFANIIRMVLNTADASDVVIYDEMFTFFKEHKNNLLSEQTVLQHIHRLPLELSIRVQTIYTVFTELVESTSTKTRFKLDYGLIRDNLKLPAQHPLLGWIRRRMGQ